MSLLRNFLIIVAFSATIGVGEGVAQSSVPSTNSAPPTSSQAAKPSVSSRIKTWTRSQWAAQRKRWAEDRVRFADCQRQLREQARTTKLSSDRQKDFLYSCMSRAR